MDFAGERQRNMAEHPEDPCPGNVGNGFRPEELPAGIQRCEGEHALYIFHIVKKKAVQIVLPGCGIIRSAKIVIDTDQLSAVKPVLPVAAQEGFQRFLVHALKPEKCPERTDIPVDIDRIHIPEGIREGACGVPLLKERKIEPCSVKMDQGREGTNKRSERHK